MQIYILTIKDIFYILHKNAEIWNYIISLNI